MSIPVEAETQLDPNAEQPPFLANNALLDAVRPAEEQGQWVTPSADETSTMLADVIETERDPSDWEIKPTGRLLPNAVLAPIYGVRVAGEGQTIHVEVCDHLTAEKMSAAVVQALGEGGRPIKYVVPPDETKPFEVTTGSPEQPLDQNVDFWLEQIHGGDNKDGVWPIFMTRNQKSGELEPYEHDERTEHRGNTALFPKELSDEITEASDLTIKYRREHGKGRLILPGEDPANDPYSLVQRGNDGYRDGVQTIDQTTGYESYLPELIKSVSLPKGQLSEVFPVFCGLAKEFLAGTRQQDDYSNLPEVLQSMEPTTVSSIVSGLIKERDVIRDIANFNKRHREGSQLTAEEAEAKADAYWQGILRVALKIRGEWQDSPEQQEDVAEDIGVIALAAA